MLRVAELRVALVVLSECSLYRIVFLFCRVLSSGYPDLEDGNKVWMNLKVNKARFGNVLCTASDEVLYM